MIPIILIFSVTCNAVRQTASAFAGVVFYYINISGSDANNGTKLHPWKTLNRLAKAQFQPGDRVCLRGNTAFSGTPHLRRITGNKEHPVFIQSGSEFKVIIQANDSVAVMLDNCAYVFINSLTAVGSGRKKSNKPMASL